MPFTAQDMLQSVRTTLQDAGNTRWTLDELRRYMNDGLRDIAFYKPNACSETKVMLVNVGTYQELPEGEHLLRAHRNITSLVGATPRVAGPIITPVDKDVIDSQFPNWHSTASVPFSATVHHVMHDTMDPRTFFVFPGNDGTGKIEVTVSRQPAEITAPASPLNIENYTQAVDIGPSYQNVLRDYVLHRAYEKDSGSPASAQRSMAHLQKFMQALTGRATIESVANVDTTEAS